jgi:hypothetical protein
VIRQIRLSSYGGLRQFEIDIKKTAGVDGDNLRFYFVSESLWLN